MRLVSWTILIQRMAAAMPYDEWAKDSAILVAALGRLMRRLPEDRSVALDLNRDDRGHDI